MKLLVADWMTKHPFKIDINEDVETARTIMREETIRHLLVLDEGNLAGIISEHDLESVAKIKARFKGQDCFNFKITVGDIMGRNPITVLETMTMPEAIREMNKRHFHSLPVKDAQGNIKGIITTTDVLRFALVASQRIDVNESFSRIAKIL